MIFDGASYETWIKKSSLLLLEIGLKCITQYEFLTVKNMFTEICCLA